MMRGKRQRVSPRGNRLESGMNAMAVRRLFILDFSRWPPFEREPIRSFGEKSRASKLGLSAANFVGKTSWSCLRIISSAERKKRIQGNFYQARRKRKRGKKGNEREIRGKNMAAGR